MIIDELLIDSIKWLCDTDIRLRTGHVLIQSLRD